MEWNRYDHFGTQLPQTNVRALSPDCAQNLRERFTRLMFAAQNKLAQHPLIRTEPYSLLEMIALLAAANATAVNRREWTNCARAPWAYPMWIVGECGVAGGTKT